MLLTEPPMTDDEINEAIDAAHYRATQIGHCRECGEEKYYREPYRCGCGGRIERAA